MAELTATAPEAQGIPSTAIGAFLDAAERQLDALHGFQLARHGHVVAEGWWHPYAAERPHMLFSVSKSFTSTAVGLAVAEGLLSIDDPVGKFFPGADDRMRIRHLLTMTTGHAEDTVDRILRAPDGDWASAFLALPVAHEPGTRFVYNTGATYLLSAIVHKLAGTPVLEYLRPRLFEPLGIADPQWETCPRGVNTGGWGLSLRTAEVTRFGQLYLDGGRWEGRQLVPAEWVREATAWQVDNVRPDATADWRQGYGYQFWRCRHGAYRADGAFGQFCLVLPEQDAVLAVTAGLAGMQAVLDLAYEHLLPAMGPEPLPADEAAAQDLADRLAGLRLPPLRSRATPAVDPTGAVYGADRPTPPPARHRGNTPPHRRGTPVVSKVTFAAGQVSIVDQSGPVEIPFADGGWRLAEVAGDAVAASGGWVDPETFVLRVQFIQAPLARTFAFRFAGDRVTVTPRDNVGFGPTDHPPVELTGTAIAGPPP